MCTIQRMVNEPTIRFTAANYRQQAQVKTKKSLYSVTLNTAVLDPDPSQETNRIRIPEHCYIEFSRAVVSYLMKMGR
jgi:hypothetical protein